MASARRVTDPQRAGPTRRVARDRRPPSARRCTPSRVGRRSPLALADAQDGDGAGLLALYDEYYLRRADGTYDNSLEAFQVISCMDTAERPTVAEDDADVAKLKAVAPRFAIRNVGSYFCTFFPPTTDPRIADHRQGCRADRGDRHHRRPGDAARRDPQDGRGPRGGPARGRRATSTPATASTPARRRRSTTTSSTRSVTCRPKACAAA